MVHEDSRSMLGKALQAAPDMPVTHVLTCVACVQALLPGLPLDWQVPVIADLAKAPAPLEVQNVPVEALVSTQCGCQSAFYWRSLLMPCIVVVRHHACAPSAPYPEC